MTTPSRPPTDPPKRPGTDPARPTRPGTDPPARSSRASSDPGVRSSRPITEPPARASTDAGRSSRPITEPPARASTDADIHSITESPVRSRRPATDPASRFARPPTDRTPIAVDIPHVIRAAIYAHAREAYPLECCGYLTGPRDGRRVNVAVVCDNAQDSGEHPTVPERGADSGFVITGRQLFDFARTFDTANPARVVYHSHPNGRAYMSAVDRAVAAPDGPAYPVQHLVVGVTADSVTEAAQFAWSADANDYVEVARWTVG